MRSRIPAAAALAVTLAVSARADAFEVKHAEDGALVRWKRDRVSWTVDPSVKQVPGGEKAVTAAIAAWTGKRGAPKLVVGTNAAQGAAIEPGFDGASAIFFAKDGYAPAGSALAITVLSFDERTGEVLDADIILNGKYDIGLVDPHAVKPISKDERGAATYDVGRIVAHEMGHALGLSDELAVTDALMYPYVPRAQKLAAQPGSDDLAGIATLYAAKPGEDASGQGCGAVVAPAGTRRVPGGAVLAAGFVVAAIVIARRKRRSAVGFVALAAVVFGAPSTSTSSTTSEDLDVVLAVRTTAMGGMFRSEVDTLDRDGRKMTRTLWGGSLAGVKQVVGGAVVPVAGQRVRLGASRTSPR